MCFYFDAVSQLFIVVLSFFAMALVANKNKWGFIVGLFSQPFWFVTTFLNRQWGLFLLTIIYVGIWSWGIYKWFFRK